MKKKLIAAVTSLVMVATMVPATVSAASIDKQAKTYAEQKAVTETDAAIIAQIKALSTVDNTAASKEKLKRPELRIKQNTVT